MRYLADGVTVWVLRGRPTIRIGKGILSHHLKSRIDGWIYVGSTILIGNITNEFRAREGGPIWLKHDRSCPPFLERHEFHWDIIKAGPPCGCFLREFRIDDKFYQMAFAEFVTWY